VKLFIKYLSLIAIVQLLNTSIKAQLNSNNFEIIKGIVIDDSTDSSIPLVNIFNESNKTWDHANEYGIFNSWVTIGDTLMFSAVGYFSKVVFFTDSCKEKDLIIKLDPLIYQLQEAKIVALKSYSRFKQDVLNLKLPKTELDSINEDMTHQSVNVAIKSDNSRIINEIMAREEGTLFVLGVGSIAGAIMDRKQEKDRTDPKRAYKNAEQQHIIASKFNGEIVHRITKLTEFELIKFMSYCDFSSEYLVLASPYEIAKTISDKFKEYNNVKIN